MRQCECDSVKRKNKSAKKNSKKTKIITITIIAMLLIAFLILSRTPPTAIQQLPKEGNERIEHNGSSIGVLIIHGLAATPYEVKSIAQELEKENHTIIAPILSGHGTTAEKLSKTTRQQWYATVEKEYSKLIQKTNKIYIVGVSLGGALALKLAEEKKITGLILIGTPRMLADTKTKYSGTLKYIIPYTNRHLTPELQKHYYAVFPTNAIYELTLLLEETAGKLDKITAPTIIFQSATDNRITQESAEYLYDSIASKNKQIIIFENTTHVIIDNTTYTNYVEKQVAKFINENEKIKNAPQ